MNIVAYCRVSTESEDQLNSLEAQKSFFEEYAQKNGHNLVKIYADEGISGTKIKNRTEFKRLLSEAALGEFEMVVVKDISRFARNTVDLLSSTRQLKEYGIETTFLTANMTVLGQSEFVLTIFGALAQEESANTSKRVKFGKRLNAEKGRVPNFVYGYDKIKGDYFNLNVNEYEAAIIKRIFEMYTADGYGASKIAQVLNHDNIKTKRGYNWSQNAISRILTNEIYVGKIVNGKEEVADFLTSKREKTDESEWYIINKPELRIVEDTIFEQAASILKRRADSFNVSHARQSDKHVFSTLIKCECCGYSFRRTYREYKNTYIKWVCSGRNANGKDKCDNITKIDEQELKDGLKQYFMQLITNKESVLAKISEEFYKIYLTKQENTTIQKQWYEHLEKATKSRNKYLDMYEDEMISREEFKEKVADLNQIIEECQNSIKLIDYNLTKGYHMERAIQDNLKDLDAALDMDNITNAQLKKLIEKIVVHQDGRLDVYLKLLSDVGLRHDILLS